MDQPHQANDQPVLWAQVRSWTDYYGKRLFSYVLRRPVAASGLQAAPYWLIATYFLHTVGELCLSPVALSAVVVSPKRFAGQMMGVFTLTYSISSGVAGLVAGNFTRKYPANAKPVPADLDVFYRGRTRYCVLHPWHKTLGVRFR